VLDPARSDSQATLAQRSSLELRKLTNTFYLRRSAADQRAKSSTAWCLVL